MSGPSIVVSATFTADAIAPILAFWMRELRFDYRIRMAPYNQVFQLLLDPGGELQWVCAKFVDRSCALSFLGR